MILLLLLQHDPFNRAHLTSDMLIPDIELKAKIDEFVKSHQSKKRTSGEDSSNKERIQTTNSDMLID
jgi:ubiquitin conjugation factor E4 B